MRQVWLSHRNDMITRVDQQHLQQYAVCSACESPLSDAPCERFLCHFPDFKMAIICAECMDESRHRIIDELESAISIYLTWENGKYRVEGSYQGHVFPGRFILKLTEPAYIGLGGMCFSNFCFLEKERQGWKAWTPKHATEFTQLDVAQNIYYEEKVDPLMCGFERTVSVSIKILTAEGRKIITL